MKDLKNSEIFWIAILGAGLIRASSGIISHAIAYYSVEHSKSCDYFHQTRFDFYNNCQNMQYHYSNDLYQAGAFVFVLMCMALFAMFLIFLLIKGIAKLNETLDQEPR